MGLFKLFNKKEEKENDNKVISFGNGCIASKKLFEGNYKVGYMYREFPSDNVPDSGWRFFVGDEDEEYTSNPENMNIYALESIISHDKDVEKYLKEPNESRFIRVNEHEFIIDDGTKQIYIAKK